MGVTRGGAQDHLSLPPSPVAASEASLLANSMVLLSLNYAGAEQ